MGQPGVRYVTLLGPTTLTTSTAFGDVGVPQGFAAATIAVTLSTVSGTSPTFDVYIQRQVPQCASTDVAPNPPTGTAVWDDILHFTQLTAAATRLVNLSTGYEPTNTANATTMTTCDWAKTDAGLGAATLRMGPIGGDWRVKVTVGGTSPSGVLAVTAELLPYGS